ARCLFFVTINRSEIVFFKELMVDNLCHFSVGGFSSNNSSFGMEGVLYLSDR
ncbi:5107_t:CDS:1, partial [Gigaspora rosea]